MVLITNDVDEGIYMADRIIPITIGPNATLGPSFEINIPQDLVIAKASIKMRNSAVFVPKLSDS